MKGPKQTLLEALLGMLSEPEQPGARHKLTWRWWKTSDGVHAFKSANLNWRKLSYKKRPRS